MDISFTFLSLASSVALLLWGTHMVQKSVEQAFGPRLRDLLGTALKTRVHAFLAGIGVTALLQSSTATGLMVAGFTAAGVVELVPALAVMLGANVGTTLVVQLLSFDISALAPALILVGVIMARRRGAGTVRELGPALIGLGLMLVALRHMIEIFTPFEDAPGLRLVMGAVATSPLIALIIGALLTWIAHSSVAIVLLAMSLAVKGVVPPEAGFALVIGANIGSALNPVIEGSNALDPASRRMPFGNLFNRLVGGALALLAIEPMTRAMVWLQPDSGRAIADFHTLFNVVMALAFLPFLSFYAALLKRLFPDKVNESDPARTLYLSSAALEMPVVAIGNAAREALRLADILETMLHDVKLALQGGRGEPVAEASQLDDVMDRLNGAIKAYLLAIPRSALTEADDRRIAEILAFATNMEQAGDVIDASMLALAAKRLKRGLTLSPEGNQELDAIFGRVIMNLRAAAALFVNDDPRAAHMLAAEKAVFRDIETKATEDHMERLRAGQSGTAEAAGLHLEVVRDLKRINAHLISGTAYPVLERGTALLANRVINSNLKE